jgi:chemotaxis protein MotA
MSVVKDTGRATVEALTAATPKRADYLALLGLLYALMRELRARPRNEVEAHIDDPKNSEIFSNFPSVQKNPDLTLFICDYVRLIIIGNARPHEIESLMDEEIATLRRDKLKPYSTLTMVSEALPALGIVAAVLGIVKAMGALDQSPQLLGSFIGAALVGTFAGIFMSYAILAPLATKVKTTREKQCRVFVIVKQSLLAFMNGALPQIAIEHGRKAISSSDRPTIDEVEAATIPGGSKGDAAQKEAA